MRKQRGLYQSKVNSSLACIHGQVTKHTTVKWPILVQHIDRYMTDTLHNTDVLTDSALNGSHVFNWCIMITCDVIDVISVNSTNWRQFLMCLSYYWSWISSSHCQSSCGSADYFDNVMTNFMINDRTDASKTDINLFFTITNYRIAGYRSLTRRMNFKFMCLSAYWQ